MLRSVVFSGHNRITDLTELARRAEALGYDRVWTTETHSRDAMLRAAAAVLATSRIRGGTGIAYAFTRAPLAMAAAPAELQVLSDGRFALGLGSMTRGMRRGWYGLELDHIAPRFADYVRLVKAAIAGGDGLRFEGPFYRADVPGFQVAGDTDAVRRLPVYGSGVNAEMLRACAGTCDGIALHSIATTLPYLDRVVVPALAAAAGKPSLAAWRIVAIAADGELARAAARLNIAFYLSTPSYASVAHDRPWAAAAEQIRAEFRRGAPWSKLAGLVDEGMLCELATAGTPGQVRADLASLEAELAPRGVDELVLQPALVGLPEDELLGVQLQLLAAAAP